jgi:hypothetical protein
VSALPPPCARWTQSLLGGRPPAERHGRSRSHPFDNFLALSDLLELVLDRPVELVTTESLSPYIGPHIVAEAEDVIRAA